MKIIGHRGARGLAPENTLDGIRTALQVGVDGVEIDVRVTDDNIVILSHDAFLIDQTNARWLISQHSYEFLAKRIPTLATLDQAISITPSDIELRIEIKPDEPIDPLVDLFKHNYTSLSKISVISFDYKLLTKLHAELPELPLILNESWSSVRARRRAKKLGTKHLQMNQRWLWCGFLKAMQHSGYLISPYTVNNPRQARRWRRYTEAIITDYPDKMQEFRR